MPRISTLVRLYGLLALLVAGFGAALGYLWTAQAGEAERMAASLRREREALVARVVELRGESLRTFAEDYSYWDELLAFVRTGSEEWARVNLDASLASFDAHGVWVLAPDGRQVHGTVRGLDGALEDLPLPFAPMKERLEKEHFVHAFATVHGSLLEFRLAPIQPSADAARTTPPAGWFVVARLWDDASLRRLGEVLGGRVHLRTPDSPHAAPHPEDEAFHIYTELPLRALDGTLLAVLCADYEPVPLTVLLADNRADKVLFASFGTLILLGGGAAIYGWIVRPLRRLERGLASRSAETLGDLPRDPDVFGRLAALAAESFAQRASLEREVEERRRAEEALRVSRDAVRQAAELRTRLARDLHDGVIQSIYAAGLGLEGLRGGLRDDPAAAERRLDAALGSLNQTIREVRSFINGLEPEESGHTDFRRALETLASTLRALHPVRIDLALASDAARLDPRQEVHGLQIVRECVSNAMRHGQAVRIEIGLGTEDGRTVLRIRDDGRGFDPATAVRGSGLANVAARAAEIGAKLDVRSSPGKGTDIRLEFPPL